jgi:membrane protein DedA with SNARE-associated domain
MHPLGRTAKSKVFALGGRRNHGPGEGPRAVPGDSPVVSRNAERSTPMLSSSRHAMPDLTQFIGAWGYAAIFLIVVLGNVGLPVPEESVLTVGGYLAWQGHLRFPVVVLVAVVSAITGDNIGYWLGRRYGQRVLRRLMAAAPARAERARAFILRHGAMAVFAARFVTGLRFMAGPVAGSAGLSPGYFFIANALGAVAYAPIVVGAGYAIGYGLGDVIERLRRAAGDAERVVLVVLALGAIVAWAVLARRTLRRS